MNKQPDYKKAAVDPYDLNTRAGNVKASYSSNNGTYCRDPYSPDRVVFVPREGLEATAPKKK